MPPTQNLPEVWMRGPVHAVPALLQPVAHALLQAKEEIYALLANFPDTLLWHQPAGMASAGFHLQHIAGVLDRMTSYAKGIALTPEQFEYLSHEATAPFENCTALELGTRLNKQIDLFIETLRQTDEDTLLLPRGVGRKQLPSNVLGLLFHAAEHTQRHLGQLLVTARIVALL